jgi:hypothetical protein
MHQIYNRLQIQKCESIQINVIRQLNQDQGRHVEFEPGKVQYTTPKFFDQLFLKRAY